MLEQQLLQEQKDIIINEVTEVNGEISNRQGENFDSAVLDEHNAMIDKYVQRTTEIEGTRNLGQYQKDSGQFGISVQTFGKKFSTSNGQSRRGEDCGGIPSSISKGSCTVNVNVVGNTIYQTAREENVGSLLNCGYHTTRPSCCIIPVCFKSGRGNENKENDQKLLQIAKSKHCSSVDP